MKDAMEHKERTLADLSVTVWLTPENASFSFEDHFLYVQVGETRERAFLCRQFPFELQWEFISVLNAENEEIGIVRDVALFGDGAALLREELERRYYAPVIKKIIGVKERYGFSYWRVTTEEGEVSFTLHDTYRSIIHAGEDRVILLDVNGNRFEIPSVAALDKKSAKKIELYL
ncbi:MAG: DUF1854 domain-containing protein [Ruminococcaceae bacterium]|nr:DUF1854 domain-containing protein [Oscillospiraceae bacterium]